MNSSELKCTVCWEPPMNPYSCKICANLVCKDCVTQLTDQKCPICRAVNQLEPDKNAKSLVGKVRIPCRLLCGDNVPVNSLEDHSHSPFCPNKLIRCNECDQLVRNKHLIAHMTEHTKQRSSSRF